MRTTVDLPDTLFREVKATAAREGLLLKQFIAGALREKLAAAKASNDKPWMKLAGCAAGDPEMIAELGRIDSVIEEEFEQVDDEDWR